MIALNHVGVKRFVYVSAADFGLANYLVRGYYEGKVPWASITTHILSISLLVIMKLNKFLRT